jgi:outer membrane protein assembly factor BamB
VLVASGPRLAAIDRATGRVVWEQEIAPKPQLALVRATGLEVAVIADSAAQVSAVDVLTGETRWAVQMDKQGLSEISVDANAAVIVVSVMGPKVGRTYFALDPATGAQRWSRRAPVHSPPPVLVPGMVILPRAGHRAELVALDPGDGGVVWRRPLGGRLNEHLLPGGDDRHIAILDLCRRVTLVDTLTGRVRWRSSVGDTPDAVSLRLTRDLVVVNAGRELVVVERGSGVVWRTDDLGLVMHDVAALGAEFAVLVDFEARGALGLVDWEAAPASPLH